MKLKKFENWKLIERQGFDHIDSEFTGEDDEEYSHSERPLRHGRNWVDEKEQSEDEYWASQEKLHKEWDGLEEEEEEEGNNYNRNDYYCQV